MKTHSLHTLALALAMGSPLQADLRSEADHRTIGEGIVAGLFEPVPLSCYPAIEVLVPGTSGRQKSGIRLTAKGVKLVLLLRFALGALVDQADKVSSVDREDRIALADNAISALDNMDLAESDVLDLAVKLLDKYGLKHEDNEVRRRLAGLLYQDPGPT